MIEVWVGAYADQGRWFPARLLGSYQANTFNEAVKLYMTEKPGSVEKVNRQKFSSESEWLNRKSDYSIWGIPLFDNEHDANARV